MCGDRAFLCSICFQPVNLTSCKFDENGRPLHEQCYVDNLFRVAKPPRSAVRWSDLSTRIARLIGLK